MLFRSAEFAALPRPCTSMSCDLQNCTMSQTIRKYPSNPSRAIRSDRKSTRLNSSHCLRDALPICRIRRAPPSLHQYVVRLAKLHNVPDDQKISLEPEPRDQIKFMLHLLLRPLHQRTIALRSVPPHHALGHALA